jgi:hypothetical protein
MSIRWLRPRSVFIFLHESLLIFSQAAAKKYKLPAMVPARNEITINLWNALTVRQRKIVVSKIVNELRVVVNALNILENFVS